VPRLKAFGNGTIDLSGWYVTAISASSIEDSGLLNLGSNKLTVGSNNLSTIFSGAIKDGGNYGGSAASLVKIGTGTVTLSGANTYTGGTSVNAGTLLVNSSRGSGTGDRSRSVAARLAAQALSPGPLPSAVPPASVLSSHLGPPLLAP